MLRALANWRSPSVTHPASTRRNPTREPFPTLGAGSTPVTAPTWRALVQPKFVTR